jgi:maltose/moltooligosaccharide transporter
MDNTITATVAPKSRLSLLQIFNMSLGFFGIQFGFALQNGQASRILRTFGADVEELSWFWLAAPLTGMLVQPLIGYYSDRTWTRLGRRRPYFLCGAILASIALFLMPNAGLLLATSVISPLFIGAGILMIMDASFNVSMEPFRALVADLLPSDQRTLGFSIQTFLIGLGAVLGSWLPYIFAEWFDIGKNAPEGVVPFNVTLSFYVGGIAFLGTILWTVFSTKEYPPGKREIEELQQTKHVGVSQIFADFADMPQTMKQLGVVQFFSWFALFSMWVFTTPAIATHVYGLSQNDTTSVTYQEAGNWVGVIFGVYNGVSALYALLLPFIAYKFGRKSTHAFSLLVGGLALISIYFIHDPILLILPMIGVGIAWASILAMPYAILAGSIPAHKMGIYMGVFNFFITLPQIINGIFGGPIVKHLYNSNAIYSLIMAGVFLIIASLCVRFVKEADETAAL